MTLAPGLRLGPYEILGQLGAGGMGEVYRAHDPRLARDVAIKVLPGELVQNHDRLRRFEREAKAAGALNHPNVLVIFDVGNDDGVPYVVSELLEGETLRRRLNGKALPQPEAVELAVQIASGLAAAHGKGIVHRDLKPENLFVTTSGLAKILDFGLAKVALPADSEAETVTDGFATEPGKVLGTLGYMSPEQLRGRRADHRSDIFSFGAVLYEMLSGARPFHGESAADTMAAILAKDPAELASLGIGAAPELSRIVMRCLAKAPDGRFQSAPDLAFALKELSTSAVSLSATLATPVDDRPSIAVLPFANLSADPEQAFFCDGMAEEVINALARVEGLRVVARTSSFAFREKQEDIREIGRRLDVRNLLEGSVRRAGDQLRITTQLISVADGSHLWSERFDRRLEDVFAIQDEIALATVEKLEVELLHRERKAIRKHRTKNINAYNLYLEGMYYWNSLTPEGYERSRSSYLAAVEADPQFTPAYVGLAVWYLSQCFWADLSPRVAIPEALTMADKALAADDSSGLLHFFLGIYHAFFERDSQAGERHLRKAIALSPGEVWGHGNLGIFLLLKGRLEEAVAEIRLAKRLDPLSPSWGAWNAAWLAYAGHREKAIADLRELIRTMPASWLAHYELCGVYAQLGRLEEAREAGERAVALSRLACVCHAKGDKERGGELFEILSERSRDSYVAPSFLAWVHLACDEPEAALERLGEAARVKDPWLSFTRLHGRVFYRFDSRVDQLLERAGC